KCRKPARLAGSRFWSRREWRDSFPASHRRKSGQRWSSRAWAKKFARFERRIHVHVKANCLGGGSGVRVLSVSLLLLGWHAPPEFFSLRNAFAEMSSGDSLIGIRGFLIDTPERGKLRAWSDGAIVIEDGLIAEIGDYGELSKKPRREPMRWLHSNRVAIFPGLI